MTPLQCRSNVSPTKRRPRRQVLRRHLRKLLLNSYSFRLGGEMKLVNFQRRQERCVSTLTFRTANAFRWSNHVDVAWRQQLHDALVEAKVLYCMLDPSLFDVPNAVASQTGLQRCSGIDSANVPETAQ